MMAFSSRSHLLDLLPQPVDHSNVRHARAEPQTQLDEEPCAAMPAAYLFRCLEARRPAKKKTRVKETRRKRCGGMLCTFSMSWSRACAASRHRQDFRIQEVKFVCEVTHILCMLCMHCFAIFSSFTFEHAHEWHKRTCTFPRRQSIEAGDRQSV